MSWSKIAVNGKEFVARNLDDRSPATVAAFVSAMPATYEMVHEQWSGAIVSTHAKGLLDTGADEPEPYQQAGTLYAATDDGSVSACYGQGRLQDGYGPRRAVPVARIVGDLDEFAALCKDVQFRGATEFTVSQTDEPDPATGGTADTGPRILLHLGDVTATAVLLQDRHPGVTTSLLDQLPLRGVATNTHSSGPLVRFWNENGGAEGVTELEVGEADGDGVTVLSAGSFYYIPKKDVCGIRIAATGPTMMRSAIRGGGLALLPLGRIVDGGEAFAAAARTIRTAGAVPMRIERA